MKVLLDTHALLWWLLDDPQLSPHARAIIASRDNRVLASAASAWEIATKVRLGKLPQAAELVANLGGYLHRSEIAVLEILEHAALAGRLEWAHKDPFDRMLAAQSQLEGAPLVTVDAVFSTNGTATIW